MNGQTDKQSHEVYLKHRREMSICGVKDVDSFDEESAVLQTQDGELTVEGEGLKIGTLDTDKGIVTVSGKINALYYTSDEGKEKRRLVSRLFK